MNLNNQNINIEFQDLRALIKTVLANPHLHEWTTQGLGMLRMYLRPEIRIHVWHEDLRIDQVSDLHTHPWDFVSLVINGSIRDLQFMETHSVDELAYLRQVIKCGEGGGLVGDPIETGLSEMKSARYNTGSSYVLTSAIIHRSIPSTGAVTLCQRRFKEDQDHAFVYWPNDEVWVSAEPREATEREINTACMTALDNWTEVSDEEI